MMKLLKWAVIALIGLVALLFAGGTMLTGQFKVARSGAGNATT